MGKCPTFGAQTEEGQSPKGWSPSKTRSKGHSCVLHLPPGGNVGLRFSALWSSGFEITAAQMPLAGPKVGRAAVHFPKGSG